MFTAQPASMLGAALQTSGFLPAVSNPSVAPEGTRARIVEAAPASALAGGLGAIVAPAAAQSGVVGAAVKRQQIGARDAVVLDLYGDQLVSFAVSDSVADQITRAIGAGGSQVALTAGVAKNVVDNVVNLGGASKADVAVRIGEKLMLGSSDEIAADQARASAFVNAGALKPAAPAAAGVRSTAATGVLADWTRARADASLAVFADPRASSGAPLSPFGASLLGLRGLTPLPSGIGPIRWIAPGRTIVFSIHRPTGSGGLIVNGTLGFGLPPGTVTVTYAITHRPGNQPSSDPGGQAGVAGGAVAGGAVAGSAAGTGFAVDGAAQAPGRGGTGAADGAAVTLTEIIPSPLDVSEESPSAQFLLTGFSPRSGSSSVSGGRGVASSADLGRGGQAGPDPFEKRQHVVEAPGCNTQYAGYTYFTRDVFGRDLIKVCTLASAAAGVR